MNKLTVGMLIEVLEDFDEDAPVHIAYDYGDYWNTTVVPAAVGVEQVEVVDSSYHRMPKLAPDDPDEVAPADEGNEQQTVVAVLAHHI